MKKGLFSFYLLSVSIISQAEPPIPPFFDVTYTLHSNDMKIGLMERKFKTLGKNSYLFFSETRTAGFISLFRKDHIIEQSRWTFTEQGFIPRTYSYQHTGGKKDRYVDITFNWDKQQIINKVNNSTWTMQTRPGILDKLLYQFTIMSDLMKGTVPEIYAIADGGKIKNYYFKHVKDEVIDTRLGKLRTMKIERRKEYSERKTWFWCAYDLDFLPVKVLITEKEGRLTTALIKELNQSQPQ